MPENKLLQIAVCDDRREDLENTAQMTSQILHEANIEHSITKYDTGISLLDDIKHGVQFHILLLDVMIDELDGITIAAELRRQENKVQIVFVSASREMAMCGYEVSAARYLAKPLDAEKLKEALLFCHRNLQAKKEILLATDKGLHRISVADIQYVEAFDRGTKSSSGMKRWRYA